jgi:hypothetical protein
MSTTTQGKAIILRFAGSGDNPGIVALLSGETSAASVQAL